LACCNRSALFPPQSKPVSPSSHPFPKIRRGTRCHDAVGFFVVTMRVISLRGHLCVGGGSLLGLSLTSGEGGLLDMNADNCMKPGHREENLPILEDSALSSSMSKTPLD